MQRGATQSENLSPKSFKICLQDATNSEIIWNEKGIDIDGEYFSYLIFTDDIVSSTQSPQDLQEMPEVSSDIHNFSRSVAFKRTWGRPRVMLNNRNNKAAVTVDGTVIGEVHKYVYLDKTVQRDGGLMSRSGDALQWDRLPSAK